MGVNPLKFVHHAEYSPSELKGGKLYWSQPDSPVELYELVVERERPDGFFVLYAKGMNIHASSEQGSQFFEMLDQSIVDKIRACEPGSRGAGKSCNFEIV